LPISENVNTFQCSVKSGAGSGATRAANLAGSPITVDDTHRADPIQARVIAFEEKVMGDLGL